MRTRTHIIHRQVVELSVPDSSNAPRLQTEIRRLFDQQLLPLMDAVMSGQVAEDEILRIERIELDLGRLPAEDLEQPLVDRIGQRLGEALARELRSASVGRHPQQAVAEPAQATPSVFTSPRASALGALEYFMQTGLLPWWHASQESYDADRQVGELLAQDANSLIALLRRLPIEATVGRLVKQLHETTLRRLIAALWVSGGEDFEQQIELWEAVMEDFPGGHWPHGRVAPFLRRLLFFGLRPEASGPVNLEDVVIDVLIEGTGSDMGTTDALTGALKEAAAGTGVGAAVWQGELDRVAQRLLERRAGRTAPAARGVKSPKSPPEAAKSDHWGSDAAGGRRAPDVAERFPVPAAPAEAPASKDKGMDGERRAMKQMPASAAAEVTGAEREGTIEHQPETAGKKMPQLTDRRAEFAEGYFVQNAGLVLLWPYVERFFRILRLTEEKAFISEEAQERAVLLLEYLVTGDLLLPENRLLLNKLLCGWALLEPVSAKLEPTKMEHREADDLIASVIGHWQALKNTSVGGFREAFLKREGRLSRDDMGWLLRIGRTGYDVLLDRLPWGIGLIRLPWMDEALRVEW